MRRPTTRRTALLATAASAIAAVVVWTRRGTRRALGFPRRTTPGNRYRRYELGSRPLLLREDFFEGRVLTNLRRKGDNP